MRTIIVTDLTEMHAGNFCVAGWDLDQNRMVRPLTSSGLNWTLGYIGHRSFWSRRILTFDEVKTPNNRAYPHASEDTFQLE